jgi:hypothetical protein
MVNEIEINTEEIMKKEQRYKVGSFTEENVRPV